MPTTAHTPSQPLSDTQVTNSISGLITDHPGGGVPRSLETRVLGTGEAAREERPEGLIDHPPTAVPHSSVSLQSPPSRGGGPDPAVHLEVRDTGGPGAAADSLRGETVQSATHACKRVHTSTYHQDPQTSDTRVLGSGEAPLPLPHGAGLDGAGLPAGSSALALRRGHWRGARSSQEAQGTQATPESEAGQKGRLPGTREACSRQVTQPASSPAKCVSETYPSQQTLSLKTTARLNRLCAAFCLSSVRGTGLNRVGDRTKPCAPRWQPPRRCPAPPLLKQSPL